jgi:uncharacterized protein involved in exopolysaccharide biosynthesis
MNHSDSVAVHQHDGSVSELAALFELASRYRRLIGLVTIAASLLAVALALTAEPVYRAQAVVAEVQDQGMTGVASSLASQLGGLASLAGINVSADASAAQHAQALLASRRLAEEFVKREDILSALTREGEEPITLWRGVEHFRTGIVSVRQDRRNSVTTVAVEWRDATVAARWANAYVALANELLRTRALEEATRNIAYLNEQIAKTNVVEVQRVMYNLIENEMNTLMLANGREEYAFTVVDPAVAPELRIRPQRRQMVVIGTVLGMMLGMALAFALDVRRRRNRSPLVE